MGGLYLFATGKWNGAPDKPVSSPRERRETGVLGVIGIVIVAHGGLAKEYLAALEHVVGPLEAARAISVGPEDSLETRQNEICAASNDVDRGDGVVLVTDLFGSTPSNLAMKACNQPDMDVLYGANLPMLVQLAKARHLDRKSAVASAVESGRRYINSRGGPTERAT
ncbi:PTS system mannose-specific EIIAB component [Pontivivens insulae]|uniref:PTS system mannose-specific EIIAB component n=1 Tax=Pontivivens insulae TaxID=1639689 RepID=A0A2R8AC99_9RHOB|nr:PTS system mannose-specific IIA component [Pontivivens insulae]SPF29690.1 PTS system mannose-specific EIIAB component [Pontivivens insulae]